MSKIAVPYRLIGEVLNVNFRYACMGIMALIAAGVLCAKSQDSLLSVSVRRAHAVFFAAGFKRGVNCVL